MNIPAISATNPNTSATSGQVDTAQADHLRNAVTAARMLNNLKITGREYSVVRDPASQRFIVIVRDGETGTVLDQFPPEEILKLLTQLSAIVAKTTGE